MLADAHTTGSLVILMAMISSGLGNPIHKQLGDTWCPVNTTFLNEYNMCLTFTTYSEERMKFSCFGHKPEEEIKEMCISGSYDDEFLHPLCKYACVEKFPNLYTFLERALINIGPTSFVNMDTCKLYKFIDFQTQCLNGKPVSCFQSLNTVIEQRASCENGLLKDTSKTYNPCRYACIDRFQIPVLINRLPSRENEKEPEKARQLEDLGMLQETSDKTLNILNTILLIILILLLIVVIILLVLKMKSTADKSVPEKNGKLPQVNNVGRFTPGDPDAVGTLTSVQFRQVDEEPRLAIDSTGDRDVHQHLLANTNGAAGRVMDTKL